MDKQTVASIAALIVVVAVVAYMIWQKETEILKSLGLIAAGFLFGSITGAVYEIWRVKKSQKK